MKYNTVYTALYSVYYINVINLKQLQIPLDNQAVKISVHFLNKIGFEW